MKIKSENLLFYEKSLSYFFIFGIFFISIRSFLIGPRFSASIFEYFISSLPEIIAGLIVLFNIQKIKNIFKDNLNRIDISVLLFIVFNLIIGLILRNDWNIFLYGLRQTYFPILFYFLGRICINSKFLLKRINFIFFLFSILGLILYFFFPDFENFMILKSGGVINYFYIKRMGSLFWTPVVFGAFMCCFSLLNVVLFLRYQSIKYYLYLIVCQICLFLSVSRGAIVAFIICYVILIFITKKLKFFIINICIISFVLYLISFFVLKDNFKSANYIVNSVSHLVHSSYKNVVVSEKKLNNYVGSKVDSSEKINRLELWKRSYDSFLVKPFGYGIGNAGHVAVRFSKIKKQDKNLSIYSTDGWYFKIANETGFLGLISFLIFCILLFLYYLKYYEGYDSIFFVLFFISVLIQNIVSNVLDFYLFSNLFWLIIGVSVKQIYHVNNRK